MGTPRWSIEVLEQRTGVSCVEILVSELEPGHIIAFSGYGGSFDIPDRFETVVSIDETFDPYTGRYVHDEATPVVRYTTTEGQHSIPLYQGRSWSMGSSVAPSSGTTYDRQKVDKCWIVKNQPT